MNLQNIRKLLVSLVGLGGIYFTYLEFLREDVTATIRTTAKAITNSHVSLSPDYYYLPRIDVVERIQTMINSWSGHYLPTIVVYGPRGAGKSTAVQIAVNQPKEKRPVLLVRITTADIRKGEEDLEMLAFKIIDSAIQPNPPVSGFHKEHCPPQF